MLASTLAHVLGIFRPDLPANLLLLTCSGPVQPAPANLLGFLRHVPAGLVAVELAVVWLTFVDTHLAGTADVGLLGLGANVVVLVLAAVVGRLAVPASAKEEA